MLLQEAITLIVVFTAAGYLARRIWLLAVRGRGGGCGGGGCSTCPGSQPTDASPPGFVPLDQISDSRSAPRD